MMDVDGSNQTNLGVAGWYPAWSPDGKRIAFSSDRDEMYDLFEIEISQSPTIRLRRLTKVLTGVFDPAWLPDQSGLLYTGFEGGGFQIFKLKLLKIKVIGTLECFI